jgi:hypothetical protein
MDQHAHAIGDLPVGTGAGQIPLATDVPTLAAAGFAFVQGLTAPPGGAPPTPVALNPLGRVPSFVFATLVTGTDGIANGPGTSVPPIGPWTVTADAVNIIFDCSLIPPNFGGFTVNVLLG